MKIKRKPKHFCLDQLFFFCWWANKRNWRGGWGRFTGAWRISLVASRGTEPSSCSNVRLKRQSRRNQCFSSRVSDCFSIMKMLFPVSTTFVSIGSAPIKTSQSSFSFPGASVHPNYIFSPSNDALESPASWATNESCWKLGNRKNPSDPERFVTIEETPLDDITFFSHSIRRLNVCQPPLMAFCY